MTPKAHNPKDGLRQYIPVFVAIIVTFGGSVGANYLLVRDVVPTVVRPDPFTGTQGAQTSALLTQHISGARAISASLDRRISVLEAQYAEILRNQQRILDRLDSM